MTRSTKGRDRDQTLIPPGYSALGRAIAKKAAKKLARATIDRRRRESEIFAELQRDHGYMIAQMPREADRHTTQVRGIGRGRITMTPARIVRLIVPATSSLGRALATQDEATARGRSRAKAKAKVKAGRGR